MYTIEKTKEIDYSKLQEELEALYGPAVSQDIVDRIRKTETTGREPDYMDVKLLSEMAEKFRAQAMMSVWRLKEWRRCDKSRRLQKNLVDLEGAFLQRQCEDAIKLYREANRSYFSMYREAMAIITFRTSTKWRNQSSQAAA